MTKKQNKTLTIKELLTDISNSSTNRDLLSGDYSVIDIVSGEGNEFLMKYNVNDSLLNKTMIKNNTEFISVLDMGNKIETTKDLRLYEYEFYHKVFKDLSLLMYEEVTELNDELNVYFEKGKDLVITVQDNILSELSDIINYALMLESSVKLMINSAKDGKGLLTRLSEDNNRFMVRTSLINLINKEEAKMHLNESMMEVNNSISKVNRLFSVRKYHRQIEHYASLEEWYDFLDTLDNHIMTLLLNVTELIKVILSTFYSNIDNYGNTEGGEEYKKSPVKDYLELMGKRLNEIITSKRKF